MKMETARLFEVLGLRFWSGGLSWWIRLSWYIHNGTICGILTTFPCHPV